jgi:hypothetical protein
VDFSPRRLFNLSHQIIAEGLQFDEDARDAFHEAMEWPEQVEVEQMNAQDRSARHSAQLIGTGNVDEMIMRAWMAHNQATAEAEAES